MDLPDRFTADDVGALPASLRRQMLVRLAELEEEEQVDLNVNDPENLSHDSQGSTGTPGVVGETTARLSRGDSWQESTPALQSSDAVSKMHGDSASESTDGAINPATGPARVLFGAIRGRSRRGSVGSQKTKASTKNLAATRFRAASDADSVNSESFVVRGNGSGSTQTSSLQARLDALLAETVQVVPPARLQAVYSECRSNTPPVRSQAAPRLKKLGGLLREFRQFSANSNSGESLSSEDDFGGVDVPRAPRYDRAKVGTVDRTEQVRMASVENERFLAAYEEFWRIPAIQAGEESGDPGEGGIRTERLKILSSYVPALVLRHLLTSPHSTIPTVRSHPTTEDFAACVMFADISGFTPLTEKLCRLGLEGVERLTSAINDYFATMIGTIHRHGGDILKFAGDAVLVVWPAETASLLSTIVVLVCQCALELISKLAHYSVRVGNSLDSPDQDVNQQLLLHIGIGAGVVQGVMLGGTNGRHEYFLAGSVLDQVSNCEKEASAGEVFVSSTAWNYAGDGRLLGLQRNVRRDPAANFMLTGVSLPVTLPSRAVREFLTAHIRPSLSTQLESFCQTAAIRHVESGGKLSCAELRKINVIFVNLSQPFSAACVDDYHKVIAALQKIIFRHEGIVRQVMIDDKGSVFIAGFGCPPLSHVDDSVRAVAAALEILEALEQAGMSGGIGVTTGHAYVGDVGSSSRREYALVGDVVNLSARLMVAAKNGILLDRTTFDEVSNASTAFEFDVLDPIRVKGKDALIQIFSPRLAFGVVEEHHHHRHHHSSQGRDKTHNWVRLVGRKSERSLLTGLASRAEDIVCEFSSKLKTADDQSENRCLSATERPLTEGISDSAAMVLLIEASQGFGKTRLLLHFSMELEHKNVSTIHSAGSQLHSSMPFRAWASVFEDLCLDHKDYSSNEERSPGHGQVSGNTVGPRSAPLLPEVIAAIGEDLCPLLQVVLPGLDFAETTATMKLASQKWAESTMQVLLSTLSVVLKPGLVLIFDDAHYFDATSWLLLERVVAQIPNIIVVVALRPTENVSLTQLLRQESSSVMQLRPFNEVESTELASQLLRVQHMPKIVASQIHAKGQGNPFYVEQICSMIRSSGTVQVARHNLVASAELLEVLKGVPSEISGIVTSKIDRLAPALQSILRLASVIGKTFEVSYLEKVLPLENDSMDRSLLLRNLAELEQLDLIFLTSPDPLRTYTFNSTLLMEVVYNGQLFSHRRDVHRQLAVLYADAYEGLSAFDGIIAHHRLRGEEFKEAQRLYVKAGSARLAQYLNTEAAELLEQARNILERRHKSGSLSHVRVLRKLGETALNRGTIADARVKFLSTLSLLGIDVESLLPNSPSNPVGAVIGIAKRMRASTVDDRITHKWRFTAEKKLSKPNQLPHRKREATIALLGLAQVAYLEGNRIACSFCAASALELAKDQGDGQHCAALCATWLTTDGILSLEAIAQRVEQARKLAGKRIESLKNVSFNAGLLHAGQSQWGLAFDNFNHAIEFGSEVGDLHSCEAAGALIATVLVLQGRFSEAIESSRKSISSATRRGDLQTQVQSLNVLAWTFSLQGSFDRAIEVLEEIKYPLESLGTIDFTAELNYTGTALVCSIHTGMIEDSVALLARLITLVTDADPTTFFSFPGYSALLECFRTIRRSPPPKSGVSVSPKRSGNNRDQMLGQIKGCANYFQKFTVRFPFAQSRADLWRGLGLFDDGKRSKADKCLNKAEDAARTLGMDYDVALCQFERGSLLSDEELIGKAVAEFPGLALCDDPAAIDSDRRPARSPVQHKSLTRGGGGRLTLALRTSSSRKSLSEFSSFLSASVPNAKQNDDGHTSVAQECTSESAAPPPADSNFKFVEYGTTESKRKK